MTKEWYKNNGYSLSVNIDQAQVDRAERDAFRAYVHPILPDVTPCDESITEELGDLAYLLLLQTTLKVTRGGVKQKTDTNSVNASEWQALSEQTMRASLAIDRLRERADAKPCAKVVDIAKIYFKTHYFYL